MFVGHATSQILKTSVFVSLLYSLLSLFLSLVHQATGSRLGTIVETLTGLVLVLVVAFIYSWVLTLVILGIVPLMMLAGLLQLKAVAGHATNSTKALESAGKVAVDSIENIRTVATLGIEESFFNQYKGLVRKPYKYVSGDNCTCKL